MFHIHGRATTRDELIFGHGEYIVELAEFDEDGESTYDMFTDAEEAARYPLYALKKPVDDILKRHENYFKQLSNVEEIIIIGHSLNTIDQPYFCRIANYAVSANWKICCYSEDEEALYIQSLVSCGVELDKIEVLEYADL
ncbi:putative uncharacterized protein [Aliivibrio wodanis]|uniref:Uncharacterized protein n=1 Tax=Aliivibrio wodanis TaxID=80852 RepID=A0A090K0W0_9GAMM|nr:putative uncharacterized protein [Aliivibrio wodanis]